MTVRYLASSTIGYKFSPPAGYKWKLLYGIVTLTFGTGSGSRLISLQLVPGQSGQNGVPILASASATSGPLIAYAASILQVGDSSSGANVLYSDLYIGSADSLQDKSTTVTGDSILAWLVVDEVTDE